MGDDQSSTTPARGYSWPPFAPGHTLSMRHGAYSPRRVDPLAVEILEAVRPSLEWLGPADEPALLAWARAEAQVQLLVEWLGKAGEETGDGVGDLDADKVRAAYLLLHRAETRAQTLRSQLGMTPLARARLGRDVAASKVDMATLMARLAEEDDAIDVEEESGDADG